jgi:hypothetical protein
MPPDGRRRRGPPGYEDRPAASSGTVNDAGARGQRARPDRGRAQAYGHRRAGLLTGEVAGPGTGVAATAGRQCAAGGPGAGDAPGRLQAQVDVAAERGLQRRRHLGRAGRVEGGHPARCRRHRRRRRRRHLGRAGRVEGGHPARCRTCAGGTGQRPRSLPSKISEEQRRLLQCGAHTRGTDSCNHVSSLPPRRVAVYALQVSTAGRDDPPPSSTAFGTDVSPGCAPARRPGRRQLTRRSHWHDHRR